MPAKTTQQSNTMDNPYGYSEMDWAAQFDPAYAATPDVPPPRPGFRPAPAWQSSNAVRGGLHHHSL
jgi:hypothetical protein